MAMLIPSHSITMRASRVNVNMIEFLISFFNLTGFPEASAERQCGLSCYLLGFCLR